MISRFLSKVSKDANSECWLWTGSLNEDLYGEWKLAGKKYKAHRASYFLFKGSIPRGCVVMHQCDNPSCVNPEHLLLGSIRDNVHDCIQKGRRGCPSYSEEQVKPILKAYLECRNYAQVGRLFNLRRSSVYQLFKKRNILVNAV